MDNSDMRIGIERMLAQNEHIRRRIQIINEIDHKLNKIEDTKIIALRHPQKVVSKYSKRDLDRIIMEKKEEITAVMIEYHSSKVEYNVREGDLLDTLNNVNNIVGCEKIVDGYYKLYIERNIPTNLFVDTSLAVCMWEYNNSRDRLRYRWLKIRKLAMIARKKTILEKFGCDIGGIINSFLREF